MANVKSILGQLKPSEKPVSITIKVPQEWKDIVVNASNLRGVDKNKVWSTLLEDKIYRLKNELDSLETSSK